MKKILIIILIITLLCSCKTQEEIKEEKNKKEINEITENISKENIPEKAKQWIIDTKTEKVLTIICTSESKKCNNIKENIEKVNKEVKTYYLEINNMEDVEKEIYKKTYELKDYTGYLPYIMLTNKGKIIESQTDKYKEEDIKKIIKK